MNKLNIININNTQHSIASDKKYIKMVFALPFHLSYYKITATKISGNLGH